MKKVWEESKGFTLIELIVIVGLISVLFAGLIMVLDPVKQLQKGRDAQRKSDIKTYQQALELHRADNGFYPSYNGDASSMGNVLNINGITYLRTLPNDPKVSNCGYAYSGNGSTYSLSTKLENLSDPDVGGPYSSSGCGSGYNYQVLSP